MTTTRARQPDVRRSRSTELPVALAASGALLLAFAAAAIAPAIAAPAKSSAAAASEQLTPVLVAVLAVPAAVPQSDGWKLPYELELTNATDAPMTIESVEARDPDRGDAVVASLAADRIPPMLVVPGGARTATLGPGQSGVLFVNAAFERREDVPRRLVHRLTVTTPTPKPPLGERTVQDVAPTAVAPASPLAIGPPLRGDRWVAAASCCDAYHRRAVLPIDGARHLAQRFAIDWLQLDRDNRASSGDPKKNESYPQFGAEALAVADAKVAHVADGLPENVPGALPSAISVTAADGNSVVLDLGGGRWALYAHLQPGSIRVRPGDRVKRGQVLGLVGNTGNSSAPHLHFHVMDGPSPLASNGVPYVIDSFEVTGRAVSPSELDDEAASGKPVPITPAGGAARRRNELPDDLAVVRFGE
ncbi:MAG TPA: M23 family metallopeptidase [Gemmatimonadaceae bacterium]|nr:M23 family metallopeptidase [Gemmatimonadaceae bacterium]